MVMDLSFWGVERGLELAVLLHSNGRCRGALLDVSTISCTKKTPPASYSLKLFLLRVRFPTRSASFSLDAAVVSCVQTQTFL